MREIDTDYLVVGAGASGMAFTDALLSNSDARVVVVDRRHRPGGHWLDAYPFVSLHQPSALYGVPSRRLGDDRIGHQSSAEGCLKCLLQRPWRAPPHPVHLDHHVRALQQAPWGRQRRQIDGGSARQQAIEVQLCNP